MLAGDIPALLARNLLRPSGIALHGVEHDDSFPQIEVSAETAGLIGGVRACASS